MTLMKRYSSCLTVFMMSLLLLLSLGGCGMHCAPTAMGSLYIPLTCPATLRATLYSLYSGRSYLNLLTRIVFFLPDSKTTTSTSREPPGLREQSKMFGVPLLSPHPLTNKHQFQSVCTR